MKTEPITGHFKMLFKGGNENQQKTGSTQRMTMELSTFIISFKRGKKNKKTCSAWNIYTYVHTYKHVS